MSHSQNDLSMSDMAELDHQSSRRQQYYQPNRSNFQIKDLVTILSFLAGIGAIYTNVNERLVKLETKGEIIAQQLVELKTDTSRMIVKLDETTRTIQSQIKDMENLILMQKPKN